jgi:hypothetical protein
VGSVARSASKSDPSPRIATHCIDELIVCPTRGTVGSRLGVKSQADSQFDVGWPPHKLWLGPSHSTSAPTAYELLDDLYIRPIPLKEYDPDAPMGFSGPWDLGLLRPNVADEPRNRPPSGPEANPVAPFGETDSAKRYLSD